MTERVTLKEAQIDDKSLKFWRKLEIEAFEITVCAGEDPSPSYRVFARHLDDHEFESVEIGKVMRWKSDDMDDYTEKKLEELLYQVRLIIQNPLIEFRPTVIANILKTRPGFDYLMEWRKIPKAKIVDATTAPGFGRF